MSDRIRPDVLADTPSSDDLLADAPDTIRARRLRAMIGDIPGAYHGQSGAPWAPIPFDATVDDLLDRLDLVLAGNRALVADLSLRSDRLRVLEADLAAMRRILGTES